MDFYSLARRDLQAPLVHIMGEIKGNDAYEEELIDYEEEDEKAHDSIAAKSGGDAVKKGYIGIHSSGFRDFLLKPELLRAIVDSGFEHPSEVQHECIPQGILGMDVICQAKFAVKAGKPWVLDPVAAGASTFCLAACLDLVELKPDVIRGNGSEILALFQASVGSTKNVDSINDSMDAIVAAKSLVEASGCIVAVSGAVDIVTDGKPVVGARNGVAILQKKNHCNWMLSECSYFAAFVVVDQFMPLKPQLLHFLKPQLLHFLYLVWLLRWQWTFCIWFLVIQPVC